MGMAEELGANALLLLTDQPAVFADWPNRSQPIRSATVGSFRSRRFEAGTMGPKVEAACRFVDSTGGRAAIGSLEDARRIIEGRAGTTVRTEGPA